MSESQITAYMVELLYATEPDIDGAALLRELRRRCGNVEWPGEEKGVFLYAFLDHLVEYADGRVPAQIFLARPSDRAASAGQPAPEEALQQSWGWPGARAAVGTCKTTLLLSELLARSLPYQTRLALFQSALEATLAVAPCQAIYWVPAEQIVDPAAYLETRGAPDVHPLRHALNVRFYNISNGQPGEMLMDTMGLATLGLPDLQCHFLNLDPQDVARVLYNSAAYLFDNGDVVEDGHTIQGIAAGDRWRCQHEMALVGPEREVLDLNPGPPHAAGDRG